MSDVQEYLKIGLQSYHEKQVEEFEKNIDLAYEADPENKEVCFYKYQLALYGSESQNLLSNFASEVDCLIPAVKSILASELSDDDKSSRIITVLVMNQKAYEFTNHEISVILKAEDDFVSFNDWEAFWFDSFNRLKDLIDNDLPNVLDAEAFKPILNSFSVDYSELAIGYRHDYSCYVKLVNKTDSWWVTEKIALIKKRNADYVAPEFKPFPKNFIMKWFAQEKHYSDFVNCDKYLGIGE